MNLKEEYERDLAQLRNELRAWRERPVEKTPAQLKADSRAKVANVILLLINLATAALVAFAMVLWAVRK